MKKILYLLVIAILWVSAGCDESGSDEKKEPQIYYTVKFDVNDNIVEPISDQYVIERDKIIRPHDPVNTNGEFIGWYKSRDGNLSEPWDFENDIVTDNITLYAMWNYGLFLKNMNLKMGISLWNLHNGGVTRSRAYPILAHDPVITGINSNSVTAEFRDGLFVVTAKGKPSTTDIFIQSQGEEYCVTITFVDAEDGTATRPFLLASLDDFKLLQTISYGTYTHYKLVVDIDLTEPWTPPLHFLGTLDGNGHYIKGLDIVKSSRDAGLFAELDNGSVVKNLRIEGAVSAYGRSGLIAGKATNSVFTNINAIGTVSADTDYAGGLVGLCDNCKVEYSKSDVYVSASNYTGGFLGLTRGGRVTSSYATGTVKAGNDNAGGIVGAIEGTKLLNEEKTAVIENSYSTGKVTTTGSNAGGIAGYAKHTEVSNVYSTGEVRAVINMAGGIIGKGDWLRLHHVYATGNVSSNATAGGIAGGVINQLSSYPSIPEMFPVDNITAMNRNLDGAALAVYRAIGSTLTAQPLSNIFSYKDMLVNNNLVTSDKGLSTKTGEDYISMSDAFINFDTMLWDTNLSYRQPGQYRLPVLTNMYGGTMSQLEMATPAHLQ